jgi:Tfp pilus assembly protein PilX
VVKGRIRIMARSKKGYSLVIVLVIMIMGVVIIGALSQYLGSSLLLATRSEERAINFYAADSGFEDTCFWIQNYKDLTGWTQSVENQSVWERDLYVVNGRTVDVDVIQVGNYTYKVTSSASMNDTVSTVIEAYIVVTTLNLSPLGDNAITSDSDIWLLGQKGGVDGLVEYVGTLTCPNDPYCEDTIYDRWNSVTQSPDGIDYWPSTQNLIHYFYHQVVDLEPFPDDIIDIAVDPTVGPLLREGDLQIKSSAAQPVYGSLNGTVYVKGNLVIGGSHDFVLNMSHHWIFCEGRIDLDSKSSIVGTGAIISIGDLSFGPQSSSELGSFLFLMSSEGGLKINPSSDFYGSVAGDIDVDLQPGVDMVWSDPKEAGFEFPCVQIPRYRTYEIIQE